MLSELIHKKFINRPAGEKLILLMTVFIFLPFFPAAILSCFAFFYILQDRNRRKAVFSAPYGFLLPLYGLLLLLSAYFHNNVEGFACSVVLNFYFIFALYSKNLANPDLANDVFDVSCLMSILCFAVSVPDYFLKYHARVSAFFYNPNFYGFMIELIILLCFYRYSVNKNDAQYSCHQRRHGFLLRRSVFIGPNGLYNEDNKIKTDHCKTDDTGALKRID